MFKLYHTTQVLCGFGSRPVEGGLAHSGKTGQGLLLIYHNDLYIICFFML